MPSIQSIMPSIYSVWGEPGTFSQLEPLDGLSRLWLKWRDLTKGCAFWGVWWLPAIVRDSTPKKTKKEAWLGIFQPNWQNHKIATSPTANIGSTPNFRRTTVTTEQHSRFRGWSRMTKFQFKMANGRHIEKCLKCYNSSTSGVIWTKLGWSHPIISPTCPPLCGCHGNGRCLATVHWTFSSYGRLEAERVIQFWWNLV